MADGTDLFDIIHTTRSMRRLKPDPVPGELVRRFWRRGDAPPTEGATSDGASWSSRTQK